MISEGYIKTFRDIFKYIPKSVVAGDLGMNNTRFTRLLDNVDEFVLRDLFRMANLAGIDELTIINLIYQQYLEDKKTKKVKTMPLQDSKQKTPLPKAKNK